MIIQKEQDITVAFLNSVLSASHFKPITSIKVRQTNYEGAMTQIRLVDLEFENDKPGISPKSLAVKFGRQLPEEHWISILRKVDQTFSRESKAYRFFTNEQVKSKFDTSIIATVYYNEVSADNCAYTIILENLEDKYFQVTMAEGVTEQLAAVALRDMAKFHGQFINKPDMNEAFEPYGKFFSNIKSFTSNNILCEQFMNRVHQLFSAEVTSLFEVIKATDLKGTPLEGLDLSKLLSSVDLPRMVNYHKTMLTNMLNFEKDDTKGLMHCDLRAENVFFSKEGIKCVDWKYALVGYPLADAIRFIVQNFQPQKLNGRYEELLEIYIKAFENTASFKVSEDYKAKSYLNYIMIEIHFLASTLSFIKDVEASQMKDLLSDFVVMTNMTMLHRAVVFYEYLVSHKLI